MEGSNEPDKSMKANDRYLQSYGITADTVLPHEYTRDPPPYSFPQTMGYLPEAPSPAPIMESNVVMGDFLDGRITNLEKKLDDCNKKLQLYEGDPAPGDLFDEGEPSLYDLFEEIPEIPGEIQTPSQPMKKYDYKTKGWIKLPFIRKSVLESSLSGFPEIQVTLPRGWRAENPPRWALREPTEVIDLVGEDHVNHEVGIVRDRINSMFFTEVTHPTGELLVFTFHAQDNSEELINNFLKHLIDGSTDGLGDMRLGQMRLAKAEMNKKMKKAGVRAPSRNPRAHHRDKEKARRAKEVVEQNRRRFREPIGDLHIPPGVSLSVLIKFRQKDHPVAVGRQRSRSGPRSDAVHFEDKNDRMEFETLRYAIKAANAPKPGEVSTISGWTGGGYKKKKYKKKKSIKKKTRRKKTRRKSKKKKTRRKSKRKYTMKRGGGIKSQELRDKREQLRKIGEIGRYSYGPEMERLSHLQSFDDRIDFRSHNNLIRRINDCEGSKKEISEELNDLKKNIVGAYYI